MRSIKYRGRDNKGNFIEGLLFYSHGIGDWKITRSNGWRPSYYNPDEGESTEYISIDPRTLEVQTDSGEWKSINEIKIL